MFSRIKKFPRYKHLKWLAFHDTLTGLYNRNWLHYNMDYVKHRYVYFIDLNDLKKINEKGHTYGDRYIQDVILRLGLSLPPEDILVRYAGDEFILFSDTLDIVETNKIYSVGNCELDLYPIEECINIADGVMMKNKINFKTKR